MFVRYKIVVFLSCLVVFAGCSAIGIDGTDTDEQWTYRFVVENEHSSPQNVTVSITADGFVHNETRRLAPGEQWVVANVTGDGTKRTYSVTLLATHQESTLTDSGTLSSTGATVYTLDTGNIISCSGSVTCYREIT